MNVTYFLIEVEKLER